MNKKIFKSLTGSLGIKIFGMIGAFGLGIALTRILGLEKYGIYSYFISIISLFAIPSYTGWSNSIIKLIKDKVLKINYLVLYTLGLNFTISIAILFFVIFSAPSLSDYYIEIFLLGLVFALPANFGAIIRASGYRILGQVPDIVFKPYIFLSALLLLNLSSYDMNISSIVYLQATCFFSIGVILLLVVNKKVPLGSVVTNNSKVFKIAIPFMLVGFANSVNANLPVILTGTFSEIEDVRLLRVAQQVTAIINIPISAALAWLAPDIDLKKAEKKVLINKVFTGIIFSLLPAIFIAVILIFFNESILDLFFGEQYVSASELVTILAINELILCSFLIFQLLLNMSGYQKHCLITLIKVIIVNVTGCFVLIPLFGAKGAVLSSLISNMFWMFLIVPFSMELLKNEAK